MKLAKKIIGLIIIIAVIFLIIYLIDHIKVIQKKIYILEHKEYVEKYANENEIDPYIIFAIIKVESNFKEHVVSKSGAIGLMQLMDGTAKEVANRIHLKYEEEKTLYDPESNIRIGTKYFTELLKKYNHNMYVSLAAYNAGQGTVDKWIAEGRIKEDGSDIENIPYKETNYYVRKITKSYQMYQKLYIE